SSMIAAVLSVLCAAFALNAYPALASAVLYDRQGPIANGVALIALFVLTLIGSRWLADALVPETVQFGLWADRIGGTAFGLIASMTMVGIVLVIMQMLPFGDFVLGYTPYDNALRRDQRVWPFCPYDFAVSIGSLGSIGAFGGEGSFNDLHADLLREAACARNMAGANGTTFARLESLRMKSAYMPTPEDLKKALKGADIPNDPLLANPMAGKVLLIGMQIDSDAGDIDDWTRLAGTQFRLVARRGEASAGDEGGKVKLTGGPIDHYPVGYLMAVGTADGEVPEWKFTAAPVNKEGKTQVGKLLATPKRDQIPVIYWVYQLGRDENPDYVVFRQVSIKEVPRCKPEMPSLPHPAGGPVAKPTTKSAKPPAKAPAKK
ncbi:MAG: CvpA family protein, partial [Candidatus Aminicenantes bacterium]|nr:CvpA family protein [Candidatus Aminicenantes bacterium]